MFRPFRILIQSGQDARVGRDPTVPVWRTDLEREDTPPGLERIAVDTKPDNRLAVIESLLGAVVMRGAEALEIVRIVEQVPIPFVIDLMVSDRR